MQDSVDPQRGEIWAIRFDPSEGDEIRKVRPGIVVSIAEAGKTRLRVVVPVTGWQPHFANYFWMTKLEPSSANGLDKVSAADSFQVKSLSTKRFEEFLGQIDPTELETVVAAVTFVIGADQP